MHDHVGRTTIQKLIVIPPAGHVTMQYLRASNQKLNDLKESNLSRILPVLGLS